VAQLRKQRGNFTLAFDGNNYNGDETGPKEEKQTGANSCHKVNVSTDAKKKKKKKKKSQWGPIFVVLKTGGLTNTCCWGGFRI
jgi:hypothetical protein